MTPFLIMVLAAYAAFVVVLGGVWMRGYVDSARRPRS